MFQMTYEEVVAPDQPAHPGLERHRLRIRQYPVIFFSGKCRPWSDCADVQADLEPRCLHMA